MVEKVCSWIFTSLHLKRLYFKVNVKIPDSNPGRLSSQRPRALSRGWTTGWPVSYSRLGKPGRWCEGGRIIANQVHSRILFLAAWCPQCGLCKFLRRPSPGWSHLTSESPPLGARHATAPLNRCLSHARHPPDLDVALLALPKWPLPPCKLLSFFKTEVRGCFLPEATLTFRCRVNYSLPPLSLTHVLFPF